MMQSGDDTGPASRSPKRLGYLDRIHSVSLELLDTVDLPIEPLEAHGAQCTDKSRG